jgi:hypothetical protein
MIPGLMLDAFGRASEALLTRNAAPAAYICPVLLQLAAGKVAAIQSLKDELMAAATAAFPDAAAVYT